MSNYVIATYIALCTLLTSWTTIFIPNGFKNYTQLYPIAIILLLFICLLKTPTNISTKNASSTYVKYCIKILWMYCNFFIIYLSLFKGCITIFEIPNLNITQTLQYTHNHWLYLGAFPFLLWPIVAIAYSLMLKTNNDPNASYFTNSVKYFNNTIGTGINLLIRQAQFTGVAILVSLMCLFLANYVLTCYSVPTSVKLNGHSIMILTLMFGFLYSNSIKNMIRKFKFHDTKFWIICMLVLIIYSGLIILSHVILFAFDAPEYLSYAFKIYIPLPSPEHFNYHWFLFATAWGLSSALPIGLSISLWSKNITLKAILLPHLIFAPLITILLTKTAWLAYLINLPFHWELLGIVVFGLYLAFGTKDNLHLLANTPVYSNLNKRKTTSALFGVFSSIAYCILLLHANNLGLISYLLAVIAIPNLIIFILMEIGIITQIYRKQMVNAPST